MSQPAAKQGDKIVGVDTHVVMLPSPAGPVPTPMPVPFAGGLDGTLSQDVLVDGKPAATDGSTATNVPAHVAPGPFQRPPANKGTLTAHGTVLIDGKPAARNGDSAITCNDPGDAPNGTVIAMGTVLIG